MRPLVSVVTVSFNAVHDIEKTILSVINQTYDNIEYIIIDGGSIDGTVDVIKKYADRITYWISELDKGIYDAMNKGIKVATGEWINFMNAGDCFANSNVVDDSIKYLTDDSDIVYGSTNFVYDGYFYERKAEQIKDLSFHQVLCHQSTFVRLVYHKNNLFDISFKSSGDYQFFYKAYFHDRVKYKEMDVLVANFDDTCGMSKDNCKIAIWENLRIRHEEKNLIPVVKSYLIIVGKYVKRCIQNILPHNVCTKIKIYKLSKQGFIVNYYD